MSSSSSSSELSESTTEACLYTLDPATKKRKRWLDGFLVRYSTTEDSHRELVALFDSSFKNKICSETSVARYNVARSSQGKMFGMGVDHIPVQLIQHVENNLPDGKKKKQKIKFRGPTLHSPFVDTIREVERLINKKTNPIVTGLPRLAVLSTARRTPEVADSGGFINYWEAAAVTRFVARLLNLDVNPSNVKVIASYVAQQYDSHESVLLLTIYFLGGQSPRCFPSVSAIVVASLKRAQGGADPPVTIFTDQTALEKTSSGVVLIYVSALNSFASPSFDADDYAYAQLGSVCLSSNGSPASTQTTIFSAIVLDSVSMLSIENCREIAIAAAPTTIFRAGEALRNTNADHLIITGSPSLLNADPLWSEFVQQAKIAADLPELFL